LFSRINQLTSEVSTEQKSKPTIVQFKQQVEKPKPVYIDKRVHKRSFEVVEIPKSVTE
jgi:hypothetical protein